MPAESNPQTPSKRPDFQVFLIKSALRRELARACEREGLTLHLAEKSLCTDNAAMMVFWPKENCLIKFRHRLLTKKSSPAGFWSDENFTARDLLFIHGPFNVCVRPESGSVRCTMELKVSPLSRWPWSSTRFQTVLNWPFVVLPVSVARYSPLVVRHSMV